jgi:putative SOS response-associated peptidase YedK
MPVSLEPQYFADWLDAKKVDSESLAGFIAEQPKGLFAYYPVSQRVNKSFEKVAGKNQRIEGADLIQPVGQTESAPQDHRLF